MASRAVVLKRLTLLLQMARGGTEHERASATDLIARLIRKHRITPGELARAGAKEQPGFDTTGISFGRNEQWPKSLAFLVGRAQGCAVLSMKSRVYFAGTDDRRAAAEKQWWHIHQQMISEFANYGQYRPKSINPGMWRQGFMMGALKKLSERMPIYQDPTPTGAPHVPGMPVDGHGLPDPVTTAIVLARRGDVDEYIKDHFETRHSPWRLPKERSSEAYSIGYSVGARISLWPTLVLGGTWARGSTLAEAIRLFRLTSGR